MNKKNWICKENHIYFYVKERIRFLLKSIRSVLCKVKKVIVSRKIIYVFYVKERIRFLLKSIRSILCKVKKVIVSRKIRSIFYVKEIFFFLKKRRLFEKGSTFMR